MEFFLFRWYFWSGRHLLRVIMLYPGILNVWKHQKSLKQPKKTVKRMIQILFDQIAVPMISILFKIFAVDNGIGGKNNEKLKNGWVNG